MTAPIFCTRCKPSRAFEGGNALLAHMDLKHPRLEKAEQQAVIEVYEAARCVVYNLSQGYRPETCPHCKQPLSRGRKGRHGTTRQTPGLADLYVVPPLRAEGEFNAWLQEPFWHETKRRHVGKQSPEQVLFAQRNEERGLAVVVGGEAEAIAELQRRGLVR